MIMEKKYLIAYAQTILNEMNTSKDTYKSIIFENINLFDISNELRENFPLIDHPNWNNNR
jgi:hypothetical protein